MCLLADCVGTDTFPTTLLKRKRPVWHFDVNFQRAFPARWALRTRLGRSYFFLCCNQHLTTCVCVTTLVGHVLLDTCNVFSRNQSHAAYGLMLCCSYKKSCSITVRYSKRSVHSTKNSPFQSNSTTVAVFPIVQLLVQSFPLEQVVIYALILCCSYEQRSIAVRETQRPADSPRRRNAPLPNQLDRHLRRPVFARLRLRRRAHVLHAGRRERTNGHMHHAGVHAHVAGRHSLVRRR